VQQVVNFMFFVCCVSATYTQFHNLFRKKGVVLLEKNDNALNKIARKPYCDDFPSVKKKPLILYHGVAQVFFKAF